MPRRKFPWYVYLILLLLYVLPIFLTQAFPDHASVISTVGAIILLPVFCAYLILTPLPLIEHFRGVRPMPFDSKPVKMIFYAILRILLCLAGFYVLVSLVIPAWRGAYALYIQGSQPDIVSGIIDNQGSGLSFVPLVGGVELQDHPGEFTWFYGHYLPYSDTQSYDLKLLPHTNIVIDVIPADTQSTTTH